MSYLIRGTGFAAFTMDELTERKNAAACYLKERGFGGSITFEFECWQRIEGERGVNGPVERSSPEALLGSGWELTYVDEREIADGMGNEPPEDDLTALKNSIDMWEAGNRAMDNVKKWEVEE